MLLKEERALVRSKVEACLLLSSQLDEVGALRRHKASREGFDVCFNKSDALIHIWLDFCPGGFTVCAKNPVGRVCA